MQSTLGGVNVSSSATQGVFDFSVEEIQERYKIFLAVKKEQPPPSPFDGQGFQDLTDTPEYLISGDQTVDLRQQPPQQAVMSDDQSKPDKLATLDQFIDNIISPPQNEAQEEDPQFSTPQFFNENMHKQHNVDDLLTELGH